MRECAAILPKAMLELSVVNQFCFNKRRKMNQFVLLRLCYATKMAQSHSVCVFVCALCMYENLIKVNNKITQVEPQAAPPAPSWAQQR